jgi:hypothetical protein
MRKTSCYQIVRDDLLRIEEAIQRLERIGDIVGMHDDLNRLMRSAADLRN